MITINNYLASLHTKALLGLRNASYRTGGQRQLENGLTITIDEIKEELAKREHIPNKQEAKVLRQKKAKLKI